MGRRSNFINPAPSATRLSTSLRCSLSFIVGTSPLRAPRVTIMARILTLQRLIKQSEMRLHAADGFRLWEVGARTWFRAAMAALLVVLVIALIHLYV